MKRHVLIAFMMVCVSTAVFPQGKFSGLAFGDFFYNISADTAMKGGNARDYNGFQFRRIYFSYDTDISQKFSLRFRTEDDQGALFTNGKIGSFIKDAYVKWKGVMPGHDLTFGMQPTPAFDISEGLWGYRSIEKTIMDYRGIVDSRDLGVSLRGTVDPGGMVGYWLLIGNGAGTSKPETDKYKRYYLNVALKPVDNLTLTVYQDYASAPNGAGGTNKGKATTALFADYGRKGSFNLGAEVFSQNAANASVRQGYSFFGSVVLSPDLAAVARYDLFDPNTSASVKGDGQNLLILGLSWAADANVWIQPHIEYLTFEKPASGTAVDPSLTGFVTLFLTF